MNFDLPRASPIISGKLSSESIYIKILLSAFKPIWDRAYGREGTWGVDHYDSGDAQIQVGIWLWQLVSVADSVVSLLFYVAAGLRFQLY